MKEYRSKMRTIRMSVMEIMTTVQELEANIAKDPAPPSKKPARGPGGRFLKKS